MARRGYWQDPCEYSGQEDEFNYVPGPIESLRMSHVLLIAQRIMNNENQRNTPYIGMLIYPVDDRLYYATGDGYKYYLEFKTPGMAQHYASVLQGLLSLSLTRFAMDEEREHSVMPTRYEAPREFRWTRGFLNAA